ncbi:hypothetical protein C4577_05080 [Candidatus Parcubacteria bacterium]|nr:MAG: hypothetical protein C4577_05080 [Candidatus Parcubacteria bacterium]
MELIMFVFDEENNCFVFVTVIRLEVQNGKEVVVCRSPYKSDLKGCNYYGYRHDEFTVTKPKEIERIKDRL